MLPISLLAAGDTAEVIDICGDEQLIARLAEKGLRAGCTLQMVQKGDPFVVCIGDTRLSMRIDGLVEIFVRPDC